MMATPASRQELPTPNAHLLQPPQNHQNLHVQRHDSRSPANSSADPNNPAVSSFQYSNSNQSSDVDFNAYIRDDGNNGYHSNWQASHNAMDQIQPNSFAQHPQASWDSHHNAAPNSLHSSTNGFISDDYVNTFSQASTGYGFNGYNSNQYQGYPSVPYNQPMGFGTGQFFSNATFPNPSSPDFGGQTSQDQTISPSALQSFPGNYQSQNHVETQVRTTFCTLIMEIILSVG